MRSYLGNIAGYQSFSFGSQFTVIGNSTRVNVNCTVSSHSYHTITIIIPLSYLKRHNMTRNGELLFFITSGK